ncbi:MAG: dihydrolipoyl dehydrogenase [Promethearchaeota archaeon]
MREFDLVVVGSGVGLTVLNQAINAGWDCALVEDAKMGGTCLTRGCIPSKVLVYPADVVREAQRAERVGLKLKLEKVDWDVVARRMWSQIDESKQIDEGLATVPNLVVYRGVGRFVGEYEMEVDLNRGGTSDRFRGKRFVIASGARSVVPPIQGLQEAGYVTSETFFGDKFPAKPWKSLAIVGGGIIAAEFAHVFSAFGTEVTIVEMLPRLLTTEEPEISLFVERNFRRHMKVLLGHRAVAAKKGKGGKVLVVEDVETKQRSEVRAEEIFVAAGRRSNADLLQVERTGVETDRHGWIKTNQYLETTKPNVWCVGDANGKYQFRHKANYDAEVVINNLFGSPEQKRAVDYSAVPWAIFTHPQVAHVGMTQAEAQAAGHQIYVAIKHYSSVAKGFAMGYERGDVDDGFVKLVVDKSYRILGAHVVGPHAAALVQPFVYLMNAGFTCAPPPEQREGIPLSKMSFACPEAGSFMPIYRAMVIHPSINEVTGWAIGNLRPVGDHGHAHGHAHEH